MHDSPSDASALSAGTRHQPVLDLLAEGFLLTGVDGTILEGNAAAAALLGLPGGQLSGESLPAFVATDDYPVFAAELDQFRAEEHPGGQELRLWLVTRSGGAIPVVLRGAAGRDRFGRSTHICWLIRDVSERRRAEMSVGESCTGGCGILAALVEAVVTLDEHGTIEAMNSGAERLFGCAAADVIGRSVTTLIAEPYRSEHAGYLAHLRDPGEARVVGALREVAGLRRDGSTFPMFLSVSAVTLGGRRCFVALARDVTASKRTEAALRESEARFRSAFEDSPVGMTLQAIDGRYLRVNAALCRMLGYTEAELLQATSGALVHPDDLSGDLEAYRRVLAGEETSYRREQRYLHKSGQVVWSLVSGSLVYDRNGVATHFALQLQDITARKELEAQLTQAQKMEALGRLAGGVAHDFNNLLAVILGYAESMGQYLPADDPLREDAQEIVAAAQRAAELTQRLLAFGRKRALQLRVIDLNAVLGGMQTMLRRLIGEQIELVIRTPAAPAWVKADAGQLEQVVMNLALNARDAMAQGGRLTLEVAAVELDEATATRLPGAQPGSHVRFTVRDTGTGMDAETRVRVFEPFFTTKRPGQGTGLGLATVYGIVTQSGGFIEVESAPGWGTTFTLHFPQCPPPVAAEEEGPVTAARPVGGVETVLLVEDEVSVRGLLRQVLSQAGYLVLEAGDGEGALRVSAEHEGPIHLLVADMVMPGMSGRQVAEALVRGRPDLRVLYISGYAREAAAEPRALDAAFLPKPFSPVVLARKVREVLDSPPGLRGGAPAP